MKKEIVKYVNNNNISGIILCGVGCLSKLSIRLADGESVLVKNDNYEIISLDEFKFSREFDSETGYKELIVDRL